MQLIMHQYTHFYVIIAIHVIDGSQVRGDLTKNLVDIFMSMTHHQETCTCASMCMSVT